MSNPLDISFLTLSRLHKSIVNSILEDRYIVNVVHRTDVYRYRSKINGTFVMTHVSKSDNYIDLVAITTREPINTPSRVLKYKLGYTEGYLTSQGHKLFEPMSPFRLLIDRKTRRRSLKSLKTSIDDISDGKTTVHNIPVSDNLLYSSYSCKIYDNICQSIYKTDNRVDMVYRYEICRRLLRNIEDLVDEKMLDVLSGCINAILNTDNFDLILTDIECMSNMTDVESEYVNPRVIKTRTEDRIMSKLVNDNTILSNSFDHIRYNTRLDDLDIDLETYRDKTILVIMTDNFTYSSKLANLLKDHYNCRTLAYTVFLHKTGNNYL